jgi:hypothetical protein
LSERTPWFFLVINYRKATFQHRDRERFKSATWDSTPCFLPLIAVGGLVGVRNTEKDPQNIFNISIQALALISGARQLF